MVALGGTLTRDPGASLAAVRNAGNRLAALLFPAAAGAWLLGATLVPLFFTARYAAAVPLFEIATLLVPFCILPSDALLRAAGDTRFLFVFSAARVPFTLALVLVGMRYGWLAGAMLGAVAAEAVAASPCCGAGGASSAIRASPPCSICRCLAVLPPPAPRPACRLVVRLVARAPLPMVLVTSRCTSPPTSRSSGGWSW